MNANKYLMITIFTLAAAFAGVSAQAHWDEAQKQAFKDAKTACMAEVKPAKQPGEKLTDAERTSVHQCMKAKGFDKHMHENENKDNASPMYK